jgi:hypothetical protein
MMFSEFNENNSLNQKNNNSTSSSSGYISYNFLFNSLSKLTNLNSSSMLFSSVFSHHRSKQHLDSAIVFSLLSPLSSSLSNFPKVDSIYTDTKFEKLLFHFVYRSFLESSSFPNTSIDSSMILEEFVAFYELSFHVFSFLSSHYYSLH